MRRLLLLAALTFMVLSPIHGDESLSTCSGNHPCTACRNCSRCFYCHVQGGYCGICSRPVPE